LAADITLTERQMKTKKRLQIAFGVLATVCLAAGGYIYYMAGKVNHDIGKQIAEGIVKPFALPAVDTQRWSQLKIGMTMDEVRHLLGDAPSKCVSSNTSNRSEFWAWGFTYGILAPVAHEKSFVVYFNTDGKVSSFHAPQVAEE
jgi:hypothetical protein